MASINEVRNHRTIIPAAQTAGEIQRVLASNGASKIMLEYDGKYEPIAISFAIFDHGREQYFKLPVNPEAMLARLKKDSRVSRQNRTIEQATMVAWRNVLMWIEAQLEFVKDGQVELSQVMLPYLLVSNNKTVWEQFRDSGLLLGDGGNTNAT